MNMTSCYLLTFFQYFIVHREMLLLCSLQINCLILRWMPIISRSLDWNNDTFFGLKLSLEMVKTGYPFWKLRQFCIHHEWNGTKSSKEKHYPIISPGVKAVPLYELCWRRNQYCQCKRKRSRAVIMQTILDLRPEDDFPFIRQHVNWEGN